MTNGLKWVILGENGLKWAKMFKETYFHTLDEKGRLAIPSKWRNTSLHDSNFLVVTKGLDSNLFVYTEQGWKEQIEERIKNLPLGNHDVRSFIRFFVSGSSECVIDRSGRIMLPQSLIEYASLKKDVVINGAGLYIEIWAKELWDKFFSDNEEKLKAFAQDFFNTPLQDNK